MEWTVRYIKRESSILSSPGQDGKYNEVTFVTRVNLIVKISLFIADFRYASKMLSPLLRDLLKFQLSPPCIPICIARERK